MSNEVTSKYITGQSGYGILDREAVSAYREKLTSTEPTLEVYAAADLVSNEIEQLAKLVKTLEERLVPVMRNNIPMEDSIRSEYASPLANRIGSFYDFIYTNNGVLRDILNRLQV